MQATVADLDEELETADDDEERILLRLRQQRMQELSISTKTARFGRVYPVSRPDYTREVTDASKEDTSPVGTDDSRKGTGVVCFLYHPSMDTSKLLAGYLDTLAASILPPSSLASLAASAYRTTRTTTFRLFSYIVTESCLGKLWVFAQKLG